MRLAAIKFSIQDMQSTIRRCSGDQKGSASGEKRIFGLQGGMASLFEKSVLCLK